VNTVMSIEEIEKQFDSEWVLVEDPETDDSLEVLRGTVTAHSKDRDEVYRHAVRSPSRRIAIVYTGVMPDDAAIVL
jgi:hypothetical protein